MSSDAIRQDMDEQPEVLRRLLTEGRDSCREVAEAIRRLAPPFAVFVARGSSDHAAQYGRYLFEVENRLATGLAAASTVTLYGRAPKLGGALVVGVSQSGQSEDVVSYLTAARAEGALTVAVVNDPKSPLAKAAEHVLDLRTGRERAVPATKTVTAEMLCLAMLAGASPTDLSRVPDAVARALEHVPASADVDALAHADGISILGRGYAYPVALELALKLKETAQVRAEAFSSADFRHGPIVLAGPRQAALVVDVGGASSPPAEEALSALTARGAPTVSLRALDASLPESLAALPTLVRGQRLALAVAAARGTDPAAPPGLQKVTVTR